MVMEASWDNQEGIQDRRAGNLVAHFAHWFRANPCGFRIVSSLCISDVGRISETAEASRCIRAPPMAVQNRGLRH